MGRKSKRHQSNKDLIARKCPAPVALPDALQVLKQQTPAKFDETVEIAMELGIDTKKSDQMVRGAVSLPRGIGREMRVIVFCKEEKVAEATEAGAIAAGGDELAARIRDEGWLDFDVAIATPDMMSVVGRLGKVLGPQGKMPSPKSGTVTPDVVTAVSEFRAGKIEFRADSGGNVHAPVGKASFEAKALQENIETFVDHIRAMRPSTSKGKYIHQVHIATTMGAGVPVDIT
ncbi:MAG: 50S ribosomal protein L1 [Planctomycetota bacterium]